MTRRLGALTALTLLGAACGADEPVEQSETTVPSTLAPTTTGPVSTEAPDDDGDGPVDEPTTTTTTATTLPDGDLGEAVVAFDEVVRLTQPIDSAVAPSGEWWIAQRTGEVLVVDPDDGEVLDTALDISADTRAGGERGLLGMAVDDDHLYLDYTDLEGTSHVDAWTLDPTTGRPTDRTPLLEQEQPFGNHNGGGLAIGPDGHLYIGFGDGGSANDPLGAGQDPTTWLGAILRIDPTPGAEAPYTVPADNPFVDGTGGRPEIFMTGLRNPWRFSFDPVTDDLWVGDVGQNLIEEVDLLLGANGWGRGANLGWNLREGTSEFSGPRPDANVDPVFEYRHGGDPGGCSVTGGRVYRGTAIPELVGTYVFGDYCTSTLWGVSIAGGAVDFRDFGLDVPGDELVSFGVDPDGELVALSLGGPVTRIVPA